MRLNPQAVINSGVSGSSSGGGIQIGTNVPSGINNKHRFQNEQERDAYFPDNLIELERLTTIIIVGADLQLWTGETNPQAYDNTKWNTMTWVIQGPQGVSGTPGEDGVGIREISATLNDDQSQWSLNFTLTDGTIKSVLLPVPEVLAGMIDKINSVDSRFSANGQVLNNLDVATTQGRYAITPATYNKPPLVDNGSVDVYENNGTVIQIIHTFGGGMYRRAKINGDWNNWHHVTNGAGGGAGLTGEQEAALNSLAERLPEISPYGTDMNRYMMQGRFCYNEATANRPNGTSTHGSVDVHACNDHVLQVATSVDGVIYHRSYTKSSQQWTQWTQVSDHTGGATIYQFPRAACVYTTAVKLDSNDKAFYIPWKYIVHDNYGCTPEASNGERPADADHWWVAPKSGSYSMELMVDVSFIQQQATIPVMIVAEAWYRHTDGRESLAAEYEMPLDVKQKVQTIKSAKLRIHQMYSHEMIRWRIKLIGGSWSDSDNPNMSMTPFRTMLIVDEVGYDTAKRIGALAFNTWAKFHARSGTAATVSISSDGNARLNAVKWNPQIVDIQAKEEAQ